MAKGAARTKPVCQKRRRAHKTPACPLCGRRTQHRGARGQKDPRPAPCQFHNTK